MIRFYCGVNETQWNYIEPQPGKYACVSPVMGSTTKSRQENRVFLNDSVERVMVDSGAFCDGPSTRVSFDQALARQLEHSQKYDYYDRIEYIASYDLLIDEKWLGGKRKKIRWTPSEAEEAVQLTVEAARYLHNNRNRVPGDLIQSAQGVTTKQYLQCVKEITPYMNLESDALGLGGWCIMGKMRRKITPVFLRTISKVIPWFAEQGGKKVHIWGVLLAQGIGPLLWLCNRHELALSTDSAGPQMKPCLGSWGYADWIDHSYSRVPTDYRGQDRAKHVEMVREWLSDFESTQYYHSPQESDYWEVGFYRERLI